MYVENRGIKKNIAHSRILITIIFNYYNIFYRMVSLKVVRPAYEREPAFDRTRQFQIGRRVVVSCSE